MKNVCIMTIIASEPQIGFMSKFNFFIIMYSCCCLILANVFCLVLYFLCLYLWLFPQNPGHSRGKNSNLQKNKMHTIQALKWYIIGHNCSIFFPKKVIISPRIFFVFYWFVTCLLGCFSLGVLCPGFVGTSHYFVCILNECV